MRTLRQQAFVCREARSRGRDRGRTSEGKTRVSVHQSNASFSIFSKSSKDNSFFLIHHFYKRHFCAFNACSSFSIFETKHFLSECLPWCYDSVRLRCTVLCFFFFFLQLLFMLLLLCNAHLLLLFPLLEWKQRFPSASYATCTISTFSSRRTPRWAKTHTNAKVANCTFLIPGNVSFFFFLPVC